MEIYFHSPCTPSWREQGKLYFLFIIYGYLQNVIGETYPAYRWGKIIGI